MPDERPATGPRQLPPGPAGSRLDAVENLRRQFENSKSRKSRSRGGSRTADPWAPTSRWDEGGAAGNWDSGAAADESARVATNSRHISDWENAAPPAGADPWGAPPPVDDAAWQGVTTDDSWDRTGTREDPWAAPSEPDEGTRTEPDGRNELGAGARNAAAQRTADPRGTRSAPGSNGTPPHRSPEYSGRRRPNGQREEAPPAPGDADRLRPENHSAATYPDADARDSASSPRRARRSRPAPEDSGEPPRIEDLLRAGLLRRGTGPADESGDDASSDDGRPGGGRRSRGDDELSGAREFGADDARDGRSYGAADTDAFEREDRGRRRRGGRRGREDSAGGRDDDESRAGGRSRRARRMPGEPLPDGGTEVAAKDACLRLLTDRARSRSELADRLATKGFSVEVANRALDRLTEVGLIDDAAFAQEWVYSRHTFSGRGKKALALELRRKGIDEDQAQEALSAISSDDETERAAELVRRKLRSLPASLDREKAIRRLVGMLARRGYNPGTAYTVVKAELEGFTFAAPGDDSEE